MTGEGEAPITTGVPGIITDCPTTMGTGETDATTTWFGFAAWREALAAFF